MTTDERKRAIDAGQNCLNCHYWWGASVQCTKFSHIMLRVMMPREFTCACWKEKKR